MTAVRAALYHPWIYLRGGIERMILEYVRRSRHEWVIYTHHYDPRSTFDELSVLNVVELRPRVPVQRSLGQLARAAATIGSARLPDDGARALLVSSEGLGDLILARTRLPAACYCHTPLKILHDRATRRRLTERDAKKAFALSIIGPAFHGVDKAMWRRYQHVFVNSAETRERVRRGGFRPAGPIEVLHPGVDPARFSASDAPRDDLFLVPGRIMFQKNIELAVDAFAAARARGLTSTLVVAGAVDEKSKPYITQLRQRAQGLPVSFEVDPTDARLIALMQSATAVVFPPPNEDFGMIPLEAMACGAPVIAVDAGGPRESIVDGQTGWLLPADADAFAGKMLEIARDPRAIDRMRAAARARAETFSWDAFAGRVDAVMEALVSGGAERV